MEGERRNLVVELISAAVMAGAYRSLARMEPGAASGLLKMADKWSGRVAALAGQDFEEEMAPRLNGRALSSSAPGARQTRA